jgi:hypothetical protein
MDTMLPVRYKITFTDADGGLGPFELGGRDDTLGSEGNTWRIVSTTPTLSEWGMIVMALLTFTGGTILYGRWRRVEVMG